MIGEPATETPLASSVWSLTFLGPVTDNEALQSIVNTVNGMPEEKQ